MQEIHSQAHLVDNPEFELPGHFVSGENFLQRPSGHIFHHYAQRAVADPIDSDNVLEFDFLHLGGLFH